MSEVGILDLTMSLILNTIDNFLDNEHLDSYLPSISIILIENSCPSKFKEVTRPSPIEGSDVSILPEEVDHYISLATLHEAST